MDAEAIRQAKLAIKISVREALGEAFSNICQAAEGAELFGDNFNKRVNEVMNLVNDIARDSHSL